MTSIFSRFANLRRSVKPIASPAVSSQDTEVTAAEQAKFLECIKAEIQAQHSQLQIEEKGDVLHILPVQLQIRAQITSRTVHADAVVECQVVRLYQDQLIPDYVEDVLAGIGENSVDAAHKGALVFTTGVFTTILDSLERRHQSEYDFYTVEADQQIQWHQIFGPVMVQGFWRTHIEEIKEEHLTALLRPLLHDKLPNQLLSWMKMYVARLPSGELIVECLLNNQHWPEAVALLRCEAEMWPAVDEFMAQRQFVAFRRCM
ncbi:DUF6348 family protein [Hymenobacter tibetensis]|uniref:DUF6348 family protein n=1 Tax=Hymenobacter tibetensis TaxID=497967 RepID=A0ABY4D109_9BACT|nr:DUF6348 family protein [Hymenobacter tibetensis]UOG73643.1 DUF6348 family protein [Hymenobacter tibetensis]